MLPNYQIRWLGDVLWTYNSHSRLFLPYPSLSLKDINTFQCRNRCKCIRISFFMQWTDLIYFFFAIRIIRKFFYLKVLNMFIKRVKIINYFLLHAEQLSCRYWWTGWGYGKVTCREKERNRIPQSRRRLFLNVNFL